MKRRNTSNAQVVRFIDPLLRKLEKQMEDEGEAVFENWLRATLEEAIE